MRKGSSDSPLTLTGQSGLPPRGTLHHSRPEDRRPARQLRQRLRVARHGSGVKVHPGGGGQAVYPRKGGEKLSRRGDRSSQDIANSVRCAQRELRAEVGEGGSFEARGILQRVGEQRVLHLGHAVKRSQWRATQHESTLPVSIHLPHR